METMSQEIGEIAAALALAQAELEPAAKNARNPMLKNRYADLSSVCEASRKVLPKHGLAISQVCMPAEPNRVCVRTILMHTSGQWLASDCVLPSEGNRGINAAQAAGSAITYARRYGLSAIIGLAADDDDASTAAPYARQAAPQTPQTDDLRKELFAVLRERGFDSPELMKKELSNFFNREIYKTASLSAEDISEYLNACKQQ